MPTYALKMYEPLVKSIAARYYWFYVKKGQRFDLDLCDFEQAGRMAVWNIAEKRSEMLKIRTYVGAAIKYAVIGELKRMRHKVPQVYLAQGYEEHTHLVDILPTREDNGKRIDEIDELHYYIKNEFSQEDADGLLSLVERCGKIYDLNLSEPPSTETKDRVRVVTKMDLTDEEIVIYAQVLLGARDRFPYGYMTWENGGKKHARKFLGALLNALGISSRDFALSRDKIRLLKKYRLMNFCRNSQRSSQVVPMAEFVQNLDPSVRPNEVRRENKCWSTHYTPETPHLPNAGYVVVYTHDGPQNICFQLLNAQTTFVHINGFPFIWAVEKILVCAQNVKTIEVQPSFEPKVSPSVLSICQERNVKIVVDYHHPNSAWKRKENRSPTYDNQRSFMLSLRGKQKEKFEELLRLEIESAMMAARYFCLNGEEYVPQQEIAELYGLRPNLNHYVSVQINAVLCYLNYSDPSFSPGESAKSFLYRMVGKVKRRRIQYKCADQQERDAEKRRRCSEKLGVPLLSSEFPLWRFNTYKALVQARERGELDGLKGLEGFHPIAWEAIILRFGLDKSDKGVYRTLQQVGDALNVTRQRAQQLEKLALEMLSIEE